MRFTLITIASTTGRFTSPVEVGGQGVNYAQAALVARAIARGDTSIA